MEAGRELDALVAEKVMGWKFVPNKDQTRGFATNFPRGRYRLGSGKSSPDLPKFSTDIAAAFQVLEKFGHWKIENDQFSIWCEVGCFDGDTEKGICNMGEASVPLETDRDVVPLAICLAALKALGVDLDSKE